jgi:hypothetical protein
MNPKHLLASLMMDRCEIEKAEGTWHDMLESKPA